MRTMLSPEWADRYKAKVLNSKVFSSYNGTYHFHPITGLIIFLLVLASSAGCGGNSYSFKEPIDEIESIEIVSAENSLEFTVLKTLSEEEQEDFLERFQTREFHKYLGARRQSVP